MSKDPLIINNPDRETLRFGDTVFSYEFFRFFNAKEAIGKLFRFEELKGGTIKVTRIELPTKSGKHWTTKDLVAVALIAFLVAFTGGLMAAARLLK